MAGLEVTGVQAGQSTTGATGGQPKQKQNIVIEFSSLPDELKTKQVRDLYDKDGSGFIEQYNTKGENEFTLMADFASSLGLDLSKYKSNIVRTRMTTENEDFETDRITIAYDNKGKVVKKLALEEGNHRILTEEMQGNTRVTNYYDESDYFTHSTHKDKVDNKGYTHVKAVENFKSGESSLVNYDKPESTLIDKDGNIIAYGDWSDSKNEKQIRYKTDNLTLGQYNLTVVNEYSGIATGENRLCSIQFSSDYDVSRFYDIPETFELSNTTYYLEGQKVKVNMLNDNTYEIINENGEVKQVITQ